MSEDTIALMASCKHHDACQRLVMLYAPFDMNAYIWCMCRACPYNKPQKDESEDVTNVLRDIDQLRRDLAKYHDALKAYDNLQRHCDNQRKELASLSAAHMPIKGERDAYRKQCDRLAAENAKLRELCGDMMWTIRHAHGYFKNDTHEMLMTYVRGRDGKPTHVAHSLTCDEEEYERRMRELGIEEEA